MNKKEIIEKIEFLKKQKDAIILSHYYVSDDLQDIADYVGDSLELARRASTTQADIIVLCGVHFMAETAKILAPTKKVLIPDITSGCPLADSIDVPNLLKYKELFPDYYVVNYINTSAAVKAYSDLICTSSNAVELIKNIDAKNILFGPDENLGIFVKNNVKDKNIILWNGHCPIHQNFSVDKLIKLKQKYPDAPLLAHPECNQQVLQYADFIGSTSKILNYVINSHHQKFIIATEPGIIHQIQKHKPSVECIPLPPIQDKPLSICVNMKKHTLEKLVDTLENEKNEIVVEEIVSQKALKSLQNMMELSLRLGLVK